jgi:ubiquinone biosynthesis monooxygenase Coq7
MTALRKLSFADRLIVGIDRVVQTLSPGTAKAERPSPASEHVSHYDETLLADDSTRKHISGLIRINHTGEVCAQALYQGQALTANEQETREAMQQSADEEIDHLAWCEQRLNELGSKPSLLNPAFYALSFGIGATAGIIGDRWSLGFIAATEEQVCKHLRDHLEKLPNDDKKSRAILEQMLVDEEAHGLKALEYGGEPFSQNQKQLMTAVSKVMTATTYRI